MTELGKSIWESSIGGIGEIKPKNKTFCYRETHSFVATPQLCAQDWNLPRGHGGTWRVLKLKWQQLEQQMDTLLEMRDRELKEEEYVEDLHSGLHFLGSTVT